MRKSNRFSLMGVLSLETVALLSGCGSSDSKSASSDAISGDTTQTSTEVSGQLVDSYIANVDYTCADGKVGVTDKNGTFTCKLFPVSFKIAGVSLGSIDRLPQDAQVFPQDIVGVDREETNNSAVLAMAQFLQSCDVDGDPSNGIEVKEEVKIALKDTNETFSAEDVEAYAAMADIELHEKEHVKEHLDSTVKFVKSVEDVSMPSDVKTFLLTAPSTLTQDAKNTLSYMGNEERLAHDVYTELYEYHKQNGTEIPQLENIAEAESTHVKTVQTLVNKYITSPDELTNIDVNISDDFQVGVDALPEGKYDIAAIQDLHDALVEMGKESQEAALKVGCMVEVTDINDLEEKIAIAEDSNASDLTQAFTFLKNGSYNHYWAFDKGLKNAGVEDGCCAIGEVDGVNYCHSEYPTNQHGNMGTNTEHETMGDASHDGEGMQKRKRYQQHTQTELNVTNATEAVAF